MLGGQQWWIKGVGGDRAEMTERFNLLVLEVTRLVADLRPLRALGEQVGEK